MSDKQKSQTWVFQANPQIYDLREALKHLKRFRWSVRQFKDEIHAGDTAYLWLAGSKGGLLARGTVKSEPEIMEELPEEIPFNVNPEKTENELRVEIEVDTVFDHPMTREDLQAHPTLRNASLITMPQATNFKLSPDEAKALTEIASESLKDRFTRFRADKYNQLIVRIRHTRAPQLRQLLSKVNEISLDAFNHEVWVYEKYTRLHGEKRTIFTNLEQDAKEIEEITEALNVGTLELHGNYIWGSGSRVYGPGLKTTDEKKLEHVRAALTILNDESLEPLDKAEKMCSIPGFGHNITTGLVMVYHPNDFAIWNKQSQGALEKLGYASSPLPTYQDSVRKLREELGADDFIQLDWFLYLINQGRIGIAAPRSVDIGKGGSTSTQYWAMGIGEGARLWKQCLKDGIIAFGADCLGDLRQFSSKNEFMDALKKHRDDDIRPTNDALACQQFAYEMKIGDYVFAKQGGGQLLGIGIIDSDYTYEPDRSEYRNTRRVKWLTHSTWEIPEGARVPIKTLTDVSGYISFLNFALPLIEKEKGGKKLMDKPQPYTLDDALQDLFVTKDDFQEILDALARKKNVVLQGPPGVGKTFIARRVAYALFGFREPAKVEMIQFHQSYSYEDFIQGWRPKESGGFERRNGVFHDFCKKAQEDKSSTYVFIIDEINRGNLSKIFGELLMLIETDKRGPRFAIPLTYASSPDERFFVPANMHVIGMMNTADRSLAMVDYALRRRFTFIDLKPAYHTDEFRSYLAERMSVESDVIDTIISRMQEINGEIRSEKTNLGPGFEIGHSFFCPQETEEDLGIEWYRSVIKSEIAPLIREYWFDASDKAEGLISRLLK